MSIELFSQGHIDLKSIKFYFLSHDKFLSTDFKFEKCHGKFKNQKRLIII